MTAFDFLRALGAPRVLVAIEIDSGYVFAATCNSAGAVERFVATRNRHSNIYFTVNPTRRPLHRKPRKDDIKQADFCHADFDPPKKEPDLTAWRVAMRDKLLDSLWPPTFLWDSGNGVQALWRLRKPAHYADFAAVEAANAGLLQTFGGPRGTHNIDRVLRLPGTTNWPTLQKRRLGRKPSQAGNLIHCAQYMYDLSELPEVKTPKARAHRLKIGAPQAIETLSALKTDDGTKFRILTCNDDGRYASRSEATFAVTCALVRDCVPNEIIAGILTDARWRVSERFLERGEAQALKAAEREIRSAHTKVFADLKSDFE